jgi:hypothetical protein
LRILPRPGTLTRTNRTPRKKRLLARYENFVDTEFVAGVNYRDPRELRRPEADVRNILSRPPGYVCSGDERDRAIAAAADRPRP